MNSNFEKKWKEAAIKIFGESAAEVITFKKNIRIEPTYNNNLPLKENYKEKLYQFQKEKKLIS